MSLLRKEILMKVFLDWSSDVISKAKSFLGKWGDSDKEDAKIQDISKRIVNREYVSSDEIKYFNEKTNISTYDDGYSLGTGTSVSSYNYDYESFLQSFISKVSSWGRRFGSEGELLRNPKSRLDFVIYLNSGGSIYLDSGVHTPPTEHIDVRGRGEYLLDGISPSDIRRMLNYLIVNLPEKETRLRMVAK